MSATNSQQLKQLQSRKSKLAVQLLAASDELAAAKKAFDKIKHQVKKVDRELVELREIDLVISEHAILRFLERTKGVDIEALKSEMLTPTTRTAIKKLGSGKYPIGGNVRLVVKQNTVVSVI